MSIVVSDGEVSIGEWTKQFNGLPVVCSRGLDFCIKSSDVDSRSTNRNFGFKPEISDWVHALVAYFSLLLWTVAAILPLLAWPKISLAIIQSIVVDMVVVFSFSHHFTMHVYFAKLSVWKEFLSHRIDHVPTIAFLRKPVRFHESVIVLCINNCIHALGEWNDFDRIVKRLFDSVTLHVVDTSHKEPSFLVQRSAAPNYINFTMLEAI